VKNGREPQITKASIDGVESSNRVYFRSIWARRQVPLLALSAIFTSLFTASIGLITNVQRAEIIGATAVYAAVLVVFVSGKLSNG